MANKPKNNYKPGNQDVCLSPPHAIEPLLQLIPKDWKIWESATGHERILENAFRKKGYNVMGTDLCFGQDYFETFDVDYDIEITNVPFSIKYAWIASAFERGKPFAFIVPYETTFAKEFQKAVTQFNGKPYQINVLSPERRINYKTPRYGWGEKVLDEATGKTVTKGGSAQMPTAWLTWGLDVEQAYANPIKTYYVKMRNVKYDAFNEEIKVLRIEQPTLF